MVLRTLVVSPYPPVRDGIANYALQQVARLRAAGERVEVLSPWPSAAHHHRRLTSARSVLGLLPLLRRFDRVVVHYHPEMFLPDHRVERVPLDLALATVFAAVRGLELLVHEADYQRGRGDGLAARAHRAMWQSARSIAVHTSCERRDLMEAFGVNPARVRVATHGAHFARRTGMDREGARRSLGLDIGETLFLSIGFIQPHKGFDRAIRAFDGLGERGCRLAVVGAVRVEDPEVLDHLEELRGLAAVVRGVDLRPGFVSDEMFDRWIVAADVIVLPYRLIWSSSVVERALLYERPIIATRVGGLGQQLAAHPLAVLVGDDAELRRAMRRAVDGVEEPAPSWPVGDDLTSETIMTEVRLRAAARRPSSGRPKAIAGSAPLRRLPPLARPSPASRKPGWTLLKRVVSKLTYWEVKDLIAHVNALHEALIEVAERLPSPGRDDDSQTGGWKQDRNP